MPEPTPHNERIIVDCTSGDETGAAAIAAAAEASLQRRFNFEIIGDVATLSAQLQSLPFEAEYLRTTHASSTEEALRLMCARLQASSAVSAVSAAPPAQLASSLGEHVSLLPGATRSALAAVVPAAKSLNASADRYAVLIDAGAHVALSPEDAMSLIALAAPLCRWFVSGYDALRVGLLTGDPDPARLPGRIRRIHDQLEASIGEEIRLSSTTRCRYLGPITPESVLLGEVDVALTDGYSGSIFVRSLEGVFVAAEALVEREQRGLRGRIGVRLMRSRLQKLRDYGDFESYGGWPLLGLNAPLVSMRADAGTRAWINSFRLCAKIRRESLLDAQRETLAALSPPLTASTTDE